MFEHYAAIPMRPMRLASPDAPSHRVRDRLTGMELIRGTLDDCRRYADAFGRCYVEEVV